MFTRRCGGEEIGLMGENKGYDEVMEAVTAGAVVQGALWTKYSHSAPVTHRVPTECWVVSGRVQGKRRGGMRGYRILEEWVERIRSSHASDGTVGRKGEGEWRKSF